MGNIPITRAEIEEIVEPEKGLQLLKPGLWYSMDEIYEIVYKKKIDEKLVLDNLSNEEIWAELFTTNFFHAVDLSVLQMRINDEIDKGKMKLGKKGEFYYYSRVE